MKKGFFLSSIAILALGALAGCGGNPTPTPSSSEAPSSQAPSSQTPSSEAPSSQAPSSQPGEKINVGAIKVWCAELAKDITAAQLDRFMEEHPNYEMSYSIDVVGEGDAATQVIQDVDGAADIYFFAQDQLSRLVAVNGIDEVYEDEAAIVRAANAESTIYGASFNGKLYAYPATADNGYFLYYNKDVFEGVDMTDLNAICDAAAAANKTIYYAYDNAWYAMGMFFGAGLVSEWETDADGNFVDYVDTLNTERGVAVATAIGNMLKRPGLFVNDSSAAGFNKGAAAVVSGTWDAVAAKTALGENFACTILPKVEIAGGEKVQMAGFSGLKLVGVKPQATEERAIVTAEIALALTSKEAQLERFDELNWGPSNLEAQQEERVLEDVVVSTILAQNAYAVPQGQSPGSWWALGGAIGANLSRGDDPATVLAQYEAGLPGCLD